MMTIQLTPASEVLFRDLAKEAPNWNGNPLIDITEAEKGNLMDLKKKGLIKTLVEDNDCVFAIFTPEGEALALEMGYLLVEEMPDLLDGNHDDGHPWTCTGDCCR